MRDKHGLTEEEFLEQYTPKAYPHPSLTADICVFRKSGPTGLQLLLVQRGGHPYLGYWATPGGFVQPDETADHAAARELEEETGAFGLALEPLALYSTPGRDPRGWTVSYSFVALDAEGVTVRAGDDAAKAAWFDVSATESEGRLRLDLTCGRDSLSTTFSVVNQAVTAMPRAADVVGDGLAFDHADIVADAWLRLRHADLL